MNDYSDILHIKRPPLKHQRMPVENRAKLYMPMDALRGFSLAILTKQVEQEFVPRTMLSADAQEILDRKLRWVTPGTPVTVTFFRMEKRIGDLEIGTYITEIGAVERLDSECRALILDNRCVPLNDIIEIESSSFSAVFTDTPEVEPYAG